jgi:response regulator NasT
VITDIKMPEIDGIDASIQICRTKPVPVILVSAHQDATLIQRAETDHIMAYLIKPVKQNDLASAIALAMHRFEQGNAVQHDATANVAD